MFEDTSDPEKARRQRMFMSNQSGPATPAANPDAITTEGGVEITTEDGQTLEQG